MEEGDGGIGGRLAGKQYMEEEGCCIGTEGGGGRLVGTSQYMQIGPLNCC